jgi:NAD(P)-dependent dehydrogenase (short-subunit alcohol dehydrogenase family)
MTMNAGTTTKLGECLRGKVAVVTGAAHGIGRATAIAFAREGADIIGLDVCAPVDPRSGVEPSNPEDLEETGRLIGVASRRWLGIKLDQRDLPGLRSAALRGEQEFGGIDILFANAGIQSFHPLLELEDADWHITIDVNLTGTANAVRAFAPYIVKRGGGRIILTSSTQGQHGTNYGAAYSASKWGIIGLMKSAALELGPYNITVNAVIPGLIDTPLTRHQERYAQVWKSAAERRRDRPLTRKRPERCSLPRHRSACLGSIPEMWHRWWCFSSLTLRGWFRVGPTTSLRVTVPTIQRDCSAQQSSAIDVRPRKTIRSATAHRSLA